ncbi:efflux transporter outer membrane subunit [Bowmanella dokdonensis]|uniref:Efflux transporter outer membrane subunit n=1 Tax=Bowmanella dokdonensis TaxID=751969 RepID=A0A939DR09_9ALTE|nr:efflux transporter outer membrane subunit [Bowmanella dokdonensis]MBN7827195.1 efflux transporter outer membrane subunit [Bowmanella dokdonensis]
MNKLKYLPLAITLCLVLPGCALGPDYQEPELAASELENASFGGADFESDQAFEPLWWRQFDDQQLNRLIQATLAHNPSLSAARANMQAAYARFLDIGNDTLPSGDLSGSYQAQDQVVPGQGTQRINSRSVRIGADLSWTIDLFGKLRRATEAAQADAEASQFAWQDLQVSLVAQVADSYATLNGLNARIEVARENLQSLARTRQIIQARFESGYASELDLLRVQAQLKGVEASLPDLEARAQRTRYLLVALAGGEQKLGGWQWQQTTLPGLRQPVALGEPVELLRQRADVRQAERRLAAATASVGVSEAAQYPALSVTGFLGFLSPGASELGSETRAWSLAPSLSLPLFDLSSVRARIQVANANQQAALANLQQQWLDAVSEAQSALHDYAKVQQRSHLLAAQVEAASRALELAQVQYDAGAIELLDLLDTQRSLLAARDNLVQAQALTFSALTEVYRAFGGGLHAESPGGALTADIRLVTNHPS